MNKTKVKRRYQEVRFGQHVISPIIQLVNFLMISYLAINDIIPIYIFAPVFILLIVMMYVAIGNRFRKIQQTTDLDMGYEKSRQQGITNYNIMKAQESIMISLNIEIPKGFNDRLEYVRKIGEGKL